MLPDLHEGRRNARVGALDKWFHKDSRSVYTDAALCQRYRGEAFAVVTLSDQPLTGLTIKTSPIQEAEDVGIALALTQRTTITVITDCQVAYRSYAAGAGSLRALRLLSKIPPSRTVTIMSTPAHFDLPGNGTAHALARALTELASDEEYISMPIEAYPEITAYC